MRVVARKRSSTQRVPERPVLIAHVDTGKRHIGFKVHALSLDGAEMVGPLTFAIGQRIDVALASVGETVVISSDVMRVDSTDLLHDRVTVRFVALTSAARAVVARLMSQLGAAADHGDDEEERVTRRLPGPEHVDEIDIPTLRRCRRRSGERCHSR